MRVFLSGLLCLSLCLPAMSDDRDAGFYDVTEESGITFVHTDGSSGQYYIVETVTAGLALFDYDNDGDPDIYFANGAALPGMTVDEAPINQLWRNEGNLTFTNVTEEAGVGDPTYSMGCIAGDVNNDGWIDLYVSNFGPNILYLNNGDGTFRDATDEWGVGDDRLGAGAAFADFNHDGWLDLFVANYVLCPLDEPISCSRLGVPLYCDPSTYDDMYASQPDMLYINTGEGSFVDATESAGLNPMLGKGMGVVCSDFDRDGWTDIFIANDISDNFLYRNLGDGTFEEIALFVGVAFDVHGREQGSMGCDAGDSDNDGWMDIVLSVYQNQRNTVYHNKGDGTFEDAGMSSGISDESLPNVSWGTFFFDYDNDGDQDVYMGNGHLQDRIEELEPTAVYKQPDQLYQNQGDGTFHLLGDEAGPGLSLAHSTRGSVYGDLDNDGDLDMVISNSREKPTVLENVTTNENSWVNVTLQGKENNRFGIGARVEVTAAGRTQYFEVRAGGSYQSQYDTRIHAGLGSADAIESITVRWPMGQVDEFTDVPVNQFVRLTEGGEWSEL